MAKISKQRKGPGTNLYKAGWIGDDGTSGLWTNFADIVINSRNGVSLIGDRKYRYSAKGIVSTKGGNDRVEGMSSTGPGIYLDTAFLLTGSGDDLIDGGFSGSAEYDSLLPDIPVISLVNSYLSTDEGNDLITAYSSTFQGGGIELVRSRITMDEGNDKISIGGEWIADVGLWLSSYSEIEMGSGDDIIDCESTVQLDLKAVIDMGDGSDTISCQDYGEYINNGSILMGSGDDILEGFGCGKGVFDGGAGSDLLRLPVGTYTVSRSSSSLFVVNESSLSMQITGFELLGSLSDPLGPSVAISSIVTGFTIGGLESVVVF